MLDEKEAAICRALGKRVADWALRGPRPRFDEGKDTAWRTHSTHVVGHVGHLAWPAGSAGGRCRALCGDMGISGLRCLPLLLYVWFALRDSLRLLIWYELVLLFYFISSVEAAFAYEADTYPLRVLHWWLFSSRSVCCISGIEAVRCGRRRETSKSALLRLIWVLADAGLWCHL
ncbi:MAG: hypothetical protein CM15mP74_21610 [Halieaceae bacterium]|nr:MAG: hypothetical protein CM15mP74_21610 [Halieaceae bacterium]